jgi:phenylpropionate dioxygenase-like ring-hydroxylating dioxygenase large terminal subunit
MNQKAQFVNKPYGAYWHREVPSEDTELTHVGPGTPAGEYLRCFWQPIAITSELGDVPKRLRVMGEDLVLFRNGNGRIGLLELHCSHRGTSLEFGRVCQQGIRCCYHGWLYDVDGRVLETPGEPANSTLKDRLYHGAYPIREYQGLIFAYMGPPEKMPVFPVYDTFEMSGYRVVPGAWIYPINWLQARENGMDPAHTAFLHTIVSNAQFTDEFGILPFTEFHETPLGMVYVSTRRVGDMVWVRIADMMLPNILQFPSNWNAKDRERVFIRPMMTNWTVPIDDTNTLVIGFYYQDAASDVDLKQMLESVPGLTGARPYEEQQRIPGDYEAQVSQRPIAIHALEHLATTDTGVIMYRKLVRRGLRAVRSGEDPKGIVRASGPPIATYSQDTFLRLPAGGNADKETALLRETGRRVLAGTYASLAESGRA